MTARQNIRRLEPRVPCFSRPKIDLLESWIDLPMLERKGASPLSVLSAPKATISMSGMQAKVISASAIVMIPGVHHETIATVQM